LVLDSIRNQTTEINLSFLLFIRTDSGAHLAAYKMGTGSVFIPKENRKCLEPAEVRNCGALPQFPLVSSWHVAFNYLSPG
jgi:hypothetical protein